GGVGQEVPDRDRRRPGLRALQAEPRETGGERLVEPELSGVAKLEDRGGGEQLGDGGDPVERLGRRRGLPLHARPAEASLPHQRLVVHHADREPGRPLYAIWPSIQAESRSIADRTSWSSMSAAMARTVDQDPGCRKPGLADSAGLLHTRTTH